jgi:hypothetical protein
VVFARQILIQQLDTSVKVLSPGLRVGIGIILVLTVPMCVTGVTLTVPIASGIKLFKKGQLRCFAVCASITPVNVSQERCSSGPFRLAGIGRDNVVAGLLLSVFRILAHTSASEAPRSYKIWKKYLANVISP